MLKHHYISLGVIPKTIRPGDMGLPIKQFYLRDGNFEPSRGNRRDVAGRVVVGVENDANAAALAEVLTENGLRLVSGGTDNHLMLVDVSTIGITGKAAEKALEEAGITVNKNAIPFDPNPPMVTSGIRIGTPALTTRGMREADMRYIGKLIARVLRNPFDGNVLSGVRKKVIELCEQFPLYS